MTAGQAIADKAVPGLTRTFVVLCLVALVLGFVGELAIQLPNIALEQAAVGGFAIGWSTAAQALGIVVSGPLAVWLLARTGSAHVLLGGCCVAVLGLAFLGSAHAVTPITLWRFILAIGTGLGVIVSQHVVMARAPAGRQATAIAVFASCFSLGTTLGPGLIRLVEPNLSTAYAVALASLLLAMFGISSAGLRGRVMHPSHVRIPATTLMSAGPSWWAAFVFGVVQNGFLALLTVYMLRLGHSVGAASAIAMAGLLGTLVLQVPLGYLADKSNPRIVLLASTLAAIGCLLALSWQPSLPMMAVLVFVLGGLCDAFYTVGLADLGRRVARRELAAANACFVLFCGVGEMAGPLVAGMGLDALGPIGFMAAFVAILLAHGIAQLRSVPQSAETPATLRMAGPHEG